MFRFEVKKMEEILKEILHIPVKEKAFDGENKLPLLLLGFMTLKYL